jgi:phosphopantothenoylcysteine decarboxylase/phosphopantothenate--cysteine ligase
MLVSGPVAIGDPPGVTTVRVEAAREMLEAVEAALPAEIAIFAAAVADWRVAQAGEQKLKKGAGGPPTFTMVENPDILATVSRLPPPKRPPLVIGFAAETTNVVDNAKAKLRQKGCDWILANDVSPQSGVFGGDSNTIHLVTAEGVETWPTQTKDEVAATLVARIAARIGGAQP